MLHHLQTKGKLDPLQFAHKRNVGVDDVILSLLHDTYTHLDKVGYFIRILFIHYSSAFNYIQPHLLAEKFVSLYFSPKLIVWLIDYIVNISQVVRYHNGLSQVKATPTGAPRDNIIACVIYYNYILVI